MPPPAINRPIDCGHHKALIARIVDRAAALELRSRASHDQPFISRAATTFDKDAGLVDWHNEQGQREREPDGETNPGQMVDTLDMTDGCQHRGYLLHHYAHVPNVAPTHFQLRPIARFSMKPSMPQDDQPIGKLRD